MDKLSKQQTKVYEFIMSYQQEKGYPPAVREICSGVGLNSTSTVHGHLSRLEKKGLIRRNPSKTRALEITAHNTIKINTQYVPLVSKVTAGKPVLTLENIEEYYALPVYLLKGAAKENIFLLRVKGDSMIQAGILDGDTLIVHNSLGVQDGDIIVARISPELLTVKRYYREACRIRLQPENSFMKPIYVQPSEIEIAGRVIGLVREY